MSEKDLLKAEDICGLGIALGEVLITDCITEDYYFAVTESLDSYFLNNCEELSLRDAIDTSIRIVLMPHHRKIEELHSALKQTQAKLDRAVKVLRKMREVTTCVDDREFLKKALKEIGEE
jgi:hypothetical protein